MIWKSALPKRGLWNEKRINSERLIQKEQPGFMKSVNNILKFVKTPYNLKHECFYQCAFASRTGIITGIYISVMQFSKDQWFHCIGAFSFISHCTKAYNLSLTSSSKFINFLANCCLRYSGSHNAVMCQNSHLGNA